MSDVQAGNHGEGAGLPVRLRAVAHALRKAFAGRRTAEPELPSAVPPAAGAAAVAAVGGAAAVAAVGGGCMAVVIEGYPQATVERILTMIRENTVEKGMSAVVVTQTVETGWIAAHGLPFEIVVGPGHARPGDPPLELRMDQQLGAIVRLWQPLVVVAFTTPACRNLAERLRCRVSAGAPADKAAPRARPGCFPCISHPWQ